MSAEAQVLSNQSRDLQDLIRRLLVKDPQQRLGSQDYQDLLVVACTRFDG